MNTRNAKYYIAKILPDNCIENTDTIVNMNEEYLEHEDFLKIIESDNFILKQFAAIKIEKLQSQDEAILLVSNLVDNDTRVREAISQKILSFLSNPNFQDYFQDEKILKIMLKGLDDVNPNVCRNIALSLKYIKDKEFFATQIIKSIKELLDGFKRERGMKKIVLNRVIFKLYWDLEALYQLQCPFGKHGNDLLEIFKITSVFEEYTIREKTAKLLANNDNEIFKNIKEKLSHDENFYVKRFFVF